MNGDKLGFGAAKTDDGEDETREDFFKDADDFDYRMTMNINSDDSREMMSTDDELEENEDISNNMHQARSSQAVPTMSAQADAEISVGHTEASATAEADIECKFKLPIRFR